MTKRSAIKSVSFADTDYDRSLLEYAMKPEHGTFSGYIKRLIERDRSGNATPTQAQTAPSTAAQARPTRTEQDRLAVRDML